MLDFTESQTAKLNAMIHAALRSQIEDGRLSALTVIEFSLGAMCAALCIPLFYVAGILAG